MEKAIEGILRSRLTHADLERLRALTDGQLDRLFLFDPHERRVEPAELRLSLADLEAVMRASDVLTAHLAELDVTRFAAVPGQRREKWEIQYSFGPADGALYEAFRGTLERDLNQLGEVTLEEGAGLDGPILTITIASTTENEYRQMKEHIAWLFELTKRALSGRPYKGNLPY